MALGARSAAARRAKREAFAATTMGWPILRRQLRADFRRSRFFLTQLVCLAVLGIALIVMISAMVDDRSMTATAIGQSLFSLVFRVQFLIILLVFPAFSATAFTEERSGQTMDLLLTTTLTPEDIVWGKFLASSIYCLLYVIASIPLLSVGFLFGGINLSEVTAAYAILIGLTLLVSMLGTSVSSFFSSNVRSTLTVYILLSVGAVAPSFWLHSALAESLAAGRAQTVVGALLDRLAPGPDGSLDRAFLVLAAGGILFLYLFLFAVNRIRPPAADRSSALRILTLITVLGIAAAGAAAGLQGSGSGADLDSAGEAVLDLVPLLAFPLFAVAVVFPTEAPHLSPRVRRRFRKLRGLFLPGRLVAPGPFWGFAYAVVLASLAAGGLLAGWTLHSGGAARPEIERAIGVVLSTLPIYVAALAAFGLFLSVHDFTPTYSRLTVIFVFLITLLLPVIFMVSRTEDAVWTLYYLSPITLWFSVRDPVVEGELPRYVLHGVTAIAIARWLFAVVAAGFLAAAILAARRARLPGFGLGAD